MRLPNGYGTVYKMSGNRRNPWAAKVTVGYNDKGHQIYDRVGYFRTRADAMQALAEYHASKDKSPAKGMEEHSVEEVFHVWDDRVLSSKSENYRKNMASTWKNWVSGIGWMPVGQITLQVVQDIVDSCPGAGMQKRIKLLIRSIMLEAVKQGYLPTGAEAIVSYAESKPANPAAKHPFSDEEIAELWKDSSSSQAARAILFLLYTGLRESEFLALDDSCVHKEEKYIEIRQSKTKAGIRIVPIHDRILPFVDELVGLHMTRPVFQYNLFHAYVSSHGMDHTTHETRHTFITRMVEAGVDQRMIKTIVGHAGGDITSDVYTHIRMDVLLEAVNRL